MTVIKFLEETAKYMAADRPELYDYNTALSRLLHMKSQLDEQDEKIFSIMTAGFSLERSEDDGVITYEFLRLVSSVAIFPDEDEIVPTNWIKDSATTTHKMDLPSPDELFDTDI